MCSFCLCWQNWAKKMYKHGFSLSCKKRHLSHFCYGFFRCWMTHICLQPVSWNKFNSDCLHQHGLWAPCGIWASKTRFPLTPFCFRIHANWPEKLEKATCPPVSLQSQKCAEGEGRDIHGGRCERGVSKIMNNPDAIGNHCAYKNILCAHGKMILHKQLPVCFNT